ncbi:MAG: acyltransferase [Bacteroides sp.]|nr:acyltransferase [Bacteroides sp.]
MTEVRKPFVKFIAYLQIIGIILVVFGHSFHEYPDDAHGTSLLIYRLCYNFRMPMFMFVSGFLMMFTEFMKDKRPSFRRFSMTKIRRLLIPYAVLTLLTYFPRAMMSGFADESVDASVAGLLDSLFVTECLPIPYFWFLQASFLLLVSTYAVIFLCRRLRLSDGMAIVVLISASVGLGCLDWNGPEIFGCKHAVFYATFFIAGIAYCRYFTTVDRYIPLDSMYSLLLTFTAWIVSFIYWEGTDYAVISSLLGIAMCISLARLMVKHNVTVIDHLIGANYIIFLLSWYFNVVTQQVLSHYIALPWQVHTLLSLTFGIYIPWLGYRFMRANQHHRLIRHISILLGQSFRSQQ